MQVQLLSAIVDKFSAVPLRRCLQTHDVPYKQTDGPSRLRRRLRAYIRTLRKGKNTEAQRLSRAAEKTCFNEQMQSIRSNWPRLVPNDLKNRIHRLFREETSSERLAEFTCASCAESRLIRERQIVPLSEINLNLLRRPDKPHTPKFDMDSESEDNDYCPSWLDIRIVDGSDENVETRRVPGLLNPSESREEDLLASGPQKNRMNLDI
jgi:hypothetical protein